jgi:LysM repeat protein
MNNGYNFYFADGSDVLTFPITPGELTISVGSNNQVVTLINEGDVNVLKSPSLTEVSFEARFPMRKYPYSREPANFQTYFDKFKELKEQKKSFRFIVVRTTPSGKRLWDTNLLVALEDFEIKESADEGDDVLISFNLKQYKEYGVRTLPNSYKKTTTSTSNKTRSGDNGSSKNQNYKVKSGDCLWNIAKKYYGSGAKWKVIYEANKSSIEATAKKYGKASSSNGHWIYPNQELVIPAQ